MLHNLGEPSKEESEFLLLWQNM